MNLLAVIITIVLLVSIFYSAFYTWLYQSAAAVDCSEMTNSMMYCDPSRYIVPLVVWYVATAAFLAVAVLFTRMQLKQQNKQ